MSNIQLAANLRRLRNGHSYTQTKMAEMLNISRQAYSNYENGKRVPDLDTLFRIADIYDVTLEQLITQSCTGDGTVNEKPGPYLLSQVRDAGGSLYLTLEEARLVDRFRNAGEDERLIIRKVLDL